MPRVTQVFPPPFKIDPRAAHFTPMRSCVQPESSPRIDKGGLLAVSKILGCESEVDTCSPLLGDLCNTTHVCSHRSAAVFFHTLRFQDNEATAEVITLQRHLLRCGGVIYDAPHSL